MFYGGYIMQLNIVNESSYKNLNIICNGNTYSLNKENTITNLDIYNNTNVEIQVLEKNRILLNLLFALVDGFVDGESVINSLVCDVSFDISESDDLQTIVIKDLEHRDDKNGYIYESVYIENNNINNLVYRLTNADKARKKALFYYVFIVSWLPFILALLGYYFLVKGNVLAILASILILLVFAIPSWKKASRVKKYYSNEFANEKLNAEYNKIITKNNKTDMPKDVIGRATYKVLDLLFKKKKK